MMSPFKVFVGVDVSRNLFAKTISSLLRIEVFGQDAKDSSTRR